MKVLIVADETERNTFITNLVKAISPHCEVSVGIKLFWESDEAYDIIHFQWPEHLSHKINRKAFPPYFGRLNKVKRRLQFWKDKNCRLVLTRHNIQSHENEKGFSSLYDLINKQADGIVHMGSYSQDEYKIRYPKAINIHTLIPHGWYDNIPNLTTKDLARKKLNIKSSTKVVLAFGALRNSEEEEYIINNFKLVDEKDKLLIIPRGYYFNKLILFRLLDFLRFPLYKWLINKKKKSLEKHQISWNQKFVALKEVQHYFNAATLVLIPRLNILNSGNVALGFFFKKMVLGPKEGNVGCILEETGNITFNPNISSSLKQELEKAFLLDIDAIGESNYKFAEQHWDWKQIGLQHFNFYNSL